MPLTTVLSRQTALELLNMDFNGLNALQKQRIREATLSANPQCNIKKLS